MYTRYGDNEGQYEFILGSFAVFTFFVCMNKAERWCKLFLKFCVYTKLIAINRQFCLALGFLICLPIATNPVFRFALKMIRFGN